MLSSLCLFGKVQSKVILIINNPNLTNYLQSLSHRRLVANLSIFIDASADIIRRKSGVLFLIHQDISQPPEAQPILTLSKFHYLIHVRYLTNLYLSQEFVPCGTSYLFLLSFIPTVCLHSNLTSANVILSPSLLSLLFLPLLGALL